MKGLAPLFLPTPAAPAVDVPVDVEAPLQDKVCALRLCWPTDKHVDGCQVYSESEITAALAAKTAVELRQALAQSRAKRGGAPCTPSGA